MLLKLMNITCISCLEYFLDIVAITRLILNIASTPSPGYSDDCAVSNIVSIRLLTISVAKFLGKEYKLAGP